MKRKKEKWFSWGYLIFWLILFWPAAIVYIMIKSREREK